MSKRVRGLSDTESEPIIRTKSRDIWEPMSYSRIRTDLSLHWIRCSTSKSGIGSFISRTWEERLT